MASLGYIERASSHTSGCGGHETSTAAWHAPILKRLEVLPAEPRLARGAGVEEGAAAGACSQPAGWGACRGAQVLRYEQSLGELLGGPDVHVDAGDDDDFCFFIRPNDERPVFINISRKSSCSSYTTKGT